MRPKNCGILAAKFFITLVYTQLGFILPLGKYRDMYGLTIDFSLEESVVTKYVDVGADLKLAAGDATCDDCAAAKRKSTT